MRSDPDAERQASRELQPGESLVWAGRPIPGRFAWSGATSILFVFALFWTAFSVYWTLQAGALLIHPRPSQPASSSEIAFVLFGIPFIAAGIIVLCKPFWAYQQANTTVYAVTSKRLLIISGLRLRRVQSISAETIARIDRREGAGGAGDLIFRPSQAAGSEPASSRIANSRASGFYAIARVRDVESTIQDTFLGLGS